MKNKMINETRIEGFLYDNDLAVKKSGPASKTPGMEYISGTVSIATDTKFLNVIQVHYTYEPRERKGKANPNFDMLYKIYSKEFKSVLEVGENAKLLRIDSAIALNDFYDRQTGELVTQKRNEGGFVHDFRDKFEDNEKHSYFRTDILITGLRRIEPDYDKNLPEKMIVKGAVFDFRKSLLPIDFVVLNPMAMNYFESLEPSQKNPIFTCVWGEQKNQYVITTKTIETAWGEPEVITNKKSEREFVITHAIANPYDFDTEETITVTELTDAMANREVYLASVKKRQDDYYASKEGTPTQVTTATSATPQIEEEIKFDF